MARPLVTVEGLPQVRKQLRQLDDGAADLKSANAAAAQLVAEAAAARAPKRSGRLAASVRGNRAVSRAQVRAGGARVAYAGPVHWGWPAHHITAQPFVVDAAQATEHVWLAAYQRDLAKLVDRIS